MRGFKHDASARDAWGQAYDTIPKSTFALIAYHLANLCAEESENYHSILARFCEEAQALAANDMLTPLQLSAVRTSIAKVS